MKNDNLKASHKALASIPFEQAVKNPDFRVIENLTMRVVHDYGSVDSSIKFHDADGHSALRVRDLHILREVSRTLPELHDTKLSIIQLTSIMEHMNTLEGQHALMKLARTHFDDWSLLNDMLDYVDNNERKYGMDWVMKFKVVAPVHPDEFSDDADIPDHRPLPPIVQSDVQKFIQQQLNQRPH